MTDTHKLGHPVPVTDDASPRNPFVLPLIAAGGFMLLVAVVIGLIPPAHSTAGGSEIVNFPSMFGQYTAVLVLSIVATGLLVGGFVTGANDWARRHRA